MFNRRFLRIKVFQALYAFQQDAKSSRKIHEKALFNSLSKTYDIYVFLLKFVTDFNFYLRKDLDSKTFKHFPDKEHINDLNALLNNKVFLKFELNETLEKLQPGWTDAEENFKNILADLRKSSLLKEYTSKETHTFAEDRKFVSEMFEHLTGNSELFNQIIEEQFINWEDDEVIVILAILKSIHSIKENKKIDFVIKFEDILSEDKEFMSELYAFTIDNDKEYLSLIADKTKNWEAERIALVDMLLMKMALCEILKFPQIPVKVSINEYLELAKIYSTPNSHGFINGVLDKIQLDLRGSNQINKTGRGLVE